MPYKTLERIVDEWHCQLACMAYTNCNWWVYDAEKLNCELFPSGHRKCDFVRGPPHPDYEKCKQDGHIHWPSSDLIL